MTATEPDLACEPTPRPTGRAEPENDRARLALAALRDDRIEDAARHAGSLDASTSPDRAWKSLVDGLVAIARGELREAETHLLKASTLACIHALSAEGHIRAEGWRLAGSTLHHLGRAYRRQDRLAEATQTHLAALRLRDESGSFDEIWETAIELGLDHDLARRYEEAQQWYRTALQAAKNAASEIYRKQAVTWTHLAASHGDEGRHEQQVSAARSARDCWRTHDVGAATAARADLNLGTALLRQGEFVSERNAATARPVLCEAVERLTAARDSLLAFGKKYAGEARLCDEQSEIGRRLLESLSE